jgi:hypothetical protein
MQQYFTDETKNMKRRRADESSARQSPTLTKRGGKAFIDGLKISR